jgi:hypothetical protein
VSKEKKDDLDTSKIYELNIIKSSKEVHAFFKIGSPLFLGHLGFICILNL